MIGNSFIADEALALATIELGYMHNGWKSHKKVSFNIASEASYVYIMSGQKLIKKAKNSQFWRVFRNLKLPRNSVTRPANLLIGQKLAKKAKIEQ